MVSMDEPFDLPPDVLRRVPLFAELQKVLAWTGGPVNWELARQIAVPLAAGERPAASVSDGDHHEIAEMVQLAELWLSEEAALPSPTVSAVRAATPVDWAEEATKAFAELIDPVASKATTAMREQTGEMGGDAQASMLAQALGQLAPMFTAIQTGMIIGQLAREVTGTHETLLPAAEGPQLLVLPTIDSVAREYELEVKQVRLWVALRAAAHRMIFDGKPFARAGFFSRYHAYVASLDFDLAEGMRKLEGIDLSDPERLQDALGEEGLFAHLASPENQAAAADISRFLAMVDAHAEAACRAAAARAGGLAAVAEAFARRDVGEARGARMLTRFIGIDPSTDRKSARAFVRSVRDARGWEAVDRLWEELEGFPSESEVAEPSRWLERVAP
jgi:putative hydrolase